MDVSKDFDNNFYNRLIANLEADGFDHYLVHYISHIEIIESSAWDEIMKKVAYKIKFQECLKAL